MSEAPRDSSTISAGKKDSNRTSPKSKTAGAAENIPRNFVGRESRRGGAGEQRPHQLGSADEIDPLLPRHGTELAANPQQEAAREGTGSMPRTAKAAPVLCPRSRAARSPTRQLMPARWLRRNGSESSPTPSPARTRSRNPRALSGAHPAPPPFQHPVAGELAVVVRTGGGERGSRERAREEAQGKYVLFKKRGTYNVTIYYT
jgi:hypothetical protein